VRKQPEVAVWGVPAERTTRFSLNRHLPGGGSERLGLNGEDGVIHYHWPASRLSVDWVRELWGAGRFQANWLVDDGGKLNPRGKSRTVDILGGGTRVRAQPNGTPATIANEYGAPFGAPSPAPPAAMPPEVVDMRVKAAEEIAAMRIKSQQEIFREQLEWQQRRADERYERLEERIEEIASSRPGRDDDDDEPSEWAWLKDLAEKLAPTIEAVLPDLLARFAGAAPKKIIEG